MEMSLVWLEVRKIVFAEETKDYQSYRVFVLFRV